MTDQHPPTHKTPQVDALRSLQEVFTIQQIQEIADTCRHLIECGGWGDVLIRFDNGRPDLIGISTTRKLPRKA